eukprot:3704654-Alexandrium_andersonii.AAC.1
MALISSGPTTPSSTALRGISGGLARQGERIAPRGSRASSQTRSSSSGTLGRTKSASSALTSPTPSTRCRCPRASTGSRSSSSLGPTTTSESWSSPVRG